MVQEKPASISNWTKVALFLPYLLLPLLGSAQHDPANDQEAVFRVTELTVAERDALVAYCQLDEQLEVSFHCVPAGIIVLNYHSSKEAQLSASVRGALGITKERLERKTQKSQAYAEQQCANARNTY